MRDRFETTVAAWVALDARDLYEVRLPGLLTAAFRGPSVAELLDDAAIALMEAVPKWPMSRLPALLLSPEVTLRRIRIEDRISFGDSRKKSDVKVRLTCHCTRWSAEGFWRVSIPRLGPETFATRDLSGLHDRVVRHLEGWAKTHDLSRLQKAESLQQDYLELIDVEVQLPSVLPSRKPRSAKRAAVEGAKKETAREWIPAHELRSVAVNLVQRAHDGRLQPALGRDQLVDDLVQQLAAEGACVLLVGPSGVGKTAVLDAVAERFAEKGGTLKARTDLWRVDGSRLIAGMSMVGAWENRLATIVDELYQRDDILVVDDLPSLAWTGRSAQSETTMAGFLLPHLQRGELRILAECTPERLEAGRLKNPGFFAHFRVIQVAALDRDRTYRVLLHQLREVERIRNLVARPALLEGVIRLGERFGARVEEPGRSVRILRGFLGDVVGDKQDRFGRTRIGLDDLHAWFARTTGLPSFVLEPDTGEAPAAIETWFGSHIVGQAAAIEAATDTVLTLQQGLDDPERPVATLLFVGPTGVGKTETAKALATYLFGDARRLLRFDMSELSGPAGVRRLVGGAGQPDGDLTRAVSNQPFSVVLFDEIEKAGPAIFDVLLQVLGEGRLTNAVGRTTDFRNCVIVMTSNLGVATARRRTGFKRDGQAADAEHFRSAARAFFRPEFFNRIDRIVPFRALGQEDVEPLVQRIVGRVLSRRGLRRAGVVVHLEPNVRDRLAAIGFDASYGARSLQRVVEREVTVPLARLLVDEPVLGRGSYIRLWQEGSVLRLALDPLQDVPAGPVPVHRVENWPDMLALYTHLVEVHQAVEEHPRWEEVRLARAALLERMNEGPLDDDAWDRLHSTSSVVEAHGELAGELEDFESEWLARYRFQDGWVKVGGELDGWNTRRERLVTQQVPVPVDRARGVGKASALLASLEERVGAVRFRVDSWGPAEPLLLVFDPLHDEGAPLAAELARAFHQAWHAWGRTVTFVEEHGLWTEGVFASGPCALAIRSPGLATLLTPELGLYLRGVDVGADRLLQLVAVRLFRGVPEDLFGTPLRAGPEGLGVVHRFGSVAADVPGAPTLLTLADDLRARAFRRVVR